MSGRADPIAVIGTGCRFPGNADTPSRLWKLIRDPIDLRTLIQDRFNTQGYYHSDGKYHGHTNAKHAYLLAGDDVHRKFDARFFGINPVEANVLDPQIRHLLEVVYEALEASGQTFEGLRGSDTAVYTGLMVGDYEHLMLRDTESIGLYHGTGTSRSLMSNRISYFFDWHGPSMTIDTACSSSLVAVHQAIQQLRSGQSRVAIAAGSNLILDPQSYISFSKLGMLSKDGRSRMWDADANGYARGEGVAAVILKSLSAAEADGDHIECIVRDTGINQDGRTNGITMPSAKAQADLIRSCYLRAGLDPSDPTHHPQYFEAHGTGTSAGDPVEAEAIQSAFCPDPSQPMFVGSVKTTIGHTESSAGLAGLIKASLAIQHATIPPNLLFRRKNPKIKALSTNLQIPLSATPWPKTSGVRRASVNNFGFGGTNAHAILEEYIPHPKLSANGNDPETLGPFTFSASSETSLISYLKSFCDYLQCDETVNLRNLAYTLRSRRTRLSISTTFVASTTKELQAKIKDRLASTQFVAGQAIGMRICRQNLELEKPKILGVFTGQGAQWPGQGLELIAYSQQARRIVEALEARLSQLPPEDRPSWSLMKELQKDPSISHLHKATLSQPLCTAIQILQIDVLKATGIEFSAVVGHSSGEIAAAYAAGRISSNDAICIAYYRGLYTDSLAEGSNGRPGAMMAVEATFSDISELCQSPEFKGRLCIAAVNSPTSITVSGDKDAIEELQIILEDEMKFARLLKVDKAYHSHHMIGPCADAYQSALTALNIQVHASGSCSWISSVKETDMACSQDCLSSSYWVDNLTKPVLFSQAIQLATSAQGSFDVAIEVGPHPALKKPVQQNIDSVPYTGLLYRSRSAIETIADSLGFLWTFLGGNFVNLESYDSFLSEHNTTVELVKGLPAYAWDHDIYWHESRYARAQRSRNDPIHPLLGHITPDSTEQEVRWRQIIRSREIQWLEGHRLQEQIVFPAAGYAVLAIEAAVLISQEQTIKVIEIGELTIGKAITFENNDASVEAVFSLTSLVRNTNELSADFLYSAADEQRTDSSLELVASGRIRISFGESSPYMLTTRDPCMVSLASVDAEEFYTSMRRLEYQYSPPFQRLHGLKRGSGTATGFISSEQDDLLIHPSVLDAAFQSVFLAYSAPYDGAIWTMHVPRSIRCIRINHALCASEMVHGRPVPFEAAHAWDTRTIDGDVSIFANDVNNAMVEVEGLTFNSLEAFYQTMSIQNFARDTGNSLLSLVLMTISKSVPLTGASDKDDVEMFSTTIWGFSSPNIAAITCNEVISLDQRQLAILLERMSVFYLRALERGIACDHACRSGQPYASLFSFASHVLNLADQGNLSFWDAEWEFDTADRIKEASEPFAHVIDLRLLSKIGQNLVEIVKGSKQAIEIGMEDQLLAEFYKKGLDISVSSSILAKTVKQLSHRYPHMDIIEVGAGTGGATKDVFREVGEDYASYTFTDVSSGFFASAKEEFASSRIAFKVLDLDHDIDNQGFTPHAYDVVIGSLVLHTTRSLERTLGRLRRLLKPGGFLVVIEGPDNAPIRYGAIFGAFTGWWAGVDDGRTLSPFVDLATWDRLLRKTEFSGCDTTTPDTDTLVKPLFVFVTQALDERIKFLREPLTVSSQRSNVGLGQQHLLLLGGRTLHTSQLAHQVQSLLSHVFKGISVLPSLKDISSARVSLGTVVASLIDLEEPFFEAPNDTTWEAFRGILLQAGSLIWITNSRSAGNPYANMIVGFLRSALHEIPTLDTQVLDFEDHCHMDAGQIAGSILRVGASKLWQRDSTQTPILASFEPEVVVDGEGRMKIPRQVINREMNDRYNSIRRPILRSTSMKGHVIDVKILSDGPVLHQRPNGADLLADTEGVHALYSLLPAIRVAEQGCMFLLVGYDHHTDRRLVTLSSENSTVVRPWANVVVPLEDERNLTVEHLPKLLTQTAYRLVASVILHGLVRGDRILIYEPTATLAAVVLEKAKSIDVEVVLTTGCPEQVDSKWIHISPTCKESRLNLLSKGISTFVDFSASSEDRSLSDRIRSHLSVHCRYENSNTLFGERCRVPHSPHAEFIQRKLEYAVRESSARLLDAYLSMQAESTATVDISNLQQGTKPHSVVDWTSISEVSVMVKRTNEFLAFSESRTYWLAGLSRGLGLSLCEFMRRHGARNFVISSRRPNVDRSWLDVMAERGANIRVLACDVTNRHEVKSVYEEVQSNLPPIAGVVQGAMVLQDRPIRDLTLDGLLKVTKPKVDGSRILNDLFQEPNTLEFFVFCSSTVAIVGNPGQSNYAAANMFMSSLAAQRRKKGLVASVINIGPILGVGYLAQEGRDLKRHVGSGGYRFLSEQDFHQLFAEAVIAGKPEPNNLIEITAGLARVSAQEQVHVPWASQPHMSHYIRNGEQGQALTTVKSESIPIKTQLARAETKDAVYQIVRQALLRKICALYQLNTDQLASEGLDAMHLDSMGTDSLLASEIRTWFMRTMQVNIPVLRILSGITIGDLLNLATDSIPLTLIPDITVKDTNPEVQDILNRAPEELSEISGTKQESDAMSELNSSYKSVATPVSSSSSSNPSYLDGDAPIVNSLPLKIAKLSFSQAMFWFVLKLLEDKTSLNHTACFRITGPIHEEEFESAVRKTCQRHEILRTCFFEQDGQLLQGVMQSSIIRGEYRQIHGINELDRKIDEIERYSFDMRKGETMRLILLSLSSTVHYLIVGTHSLIMDGQSSQIFLKDLQQHYEHACQPSTRTPIPKPMQFFDHLIQQHHDLGNGSFDRDLRFWKSELADLPPPLPLLRLGRLVSRPLLMAYDNVRADLRIPTETKIKIQAVCSHYRTTPFHFYLTVFRVLLLRHSGATDFATGISDANRTDEATMSSIGSFVNLLPLNFHSESSATFGQMLEETRKMAYAALAHSRLPFPVLLEELDIPRSTLHTPVFQSFVDYRIGQREKLTWENCELEMLSFTASKLGYDVSVDIIDNPNSDCLAMLIVRKDLYGPKDAERLATSYSHLIQQFVAQPRALVSEPSLFLQNEIDEAFKFSRGPLHDRTWPETLIHRIDEVADDRGYHNAIEWSDGGPTTYLELLRSTSTIAHCLEINGATPGMRIAVLQEPTPDWIASLLAIMRIGAIYIPLDQGNPWPRLATIMSDCSPNIILVDEYTEKHVDKLHPPELAVINVSTITVTTPERISIKATAYSTATLLYTSGSTGKPKAIELHHEGLRNWLESSPKIYELDSECVLQQSSVGFDMSLIQIFTALCLGGVLFLVPRRLRGDAEAISALINSKRITYTFSCTSELSAWLTYGSFDQFSTSCWRRAVTGGESGVGALIPQFAALAKRDLRLFHAYGPTETSFTATTMELLYENDTFKHATNRKAIPVGFPLPNYSVYVVDESMELVPVGVQGEICIGGPGVAAGYINNTELTSQRFVPNVFAASEGVVGSRNILHRTGDLGRWGENGALFIEGRVSGDTQVKLRGLRIDLQEIERALMDAAQGSISEAVVSLRSSPSSSNLEVLVAHVTFDQRRTSEHRSELLDLLPSQMNVPRYMCPSVIVPIDRMPLTNTRKLDRIAIAALPLPEARSPTNSHLTAIESELKDLWGEVISAEILNSHNLTSESDFFHVGGTSLLLLTLQVRIQECFKTKMQLMDMFGSSSLGSMARKIERGKEDEPLEQLFDWKNETELFPPLHDAKTMQPVATSQYRSVSLTGVTGYLGRAILDALVNDHTVERIHCIAVRNANSRHDLMKSDKVILYEGDLLQQRLGLSESDAKKIFDSTDVIVHNGADVSYMKTYQSLRLPNVQSTKELANLCLPRLIPIHYISSGGACSFAAAAGQDRISPLSVAKYGPPSNAPHGYSATKWASEVFLEKLHTRYPNWPIWIHRPSNIARIDDPQLDLVHSLQRYSQLLRAVPVVRGTVRGQINSVALYTVVKGIMDAVRETAGRERDGKRMVSRNLRYSHHLGEVSLPLDDIRSWVPENLNQSPRQEDPDGYQMDIAEITLDEWAVRAEELGMHPNLVAFMRSLAHQNGFVFPTLARE